MVKANNATRKLLILIVDDNMNFVERMISLLEEVRHIGYINVASDFSEAYRYMSEEIPDLVLLDINLPGKSGIEILRRIRSEGHDSTVIMLTNHHDEYYRQLCRDLGANHFLDKSSDFNKVPAIIEEISAG